MTKSNFSSTQNPQNFSFGSSRLLNYFGLASSAISSQLGFFCISLPQYDFFLWLCIPTGKEMWGISLLSCCLLIPSLIWLLFMTFWARQQWSLSLDWLFFIVRVQTISWYPLNLFLWVEFCGSFLLIFKSSI